MRDLLVSHVRSPISPFRNDSGPVRFSLLQRIKRKLVGEEVKGVGVMKDEELKLEEIEASLTLSVVYYESLKRELKTKTIYEYRCDERLIKLT